jgi:hypothetical protein
MRLLQQDRVAIKQLLVVTIENFKKFQTGGQNFQEAKKGLKNALELKILQALPVHRCSTSFCLTERSWMTD